MRALAERLSVRPSSLYRHYPDRAALVAALEDHAALALHGALREASRDLPPGRPWAPPPTLTLTTRGLTRTSTG